MLFSTGRSGIELFLHNTGLSKLLRSAIIRGLIQDIQPSLAALINRRSLEELIKLPEVQTLLNDRSFLEKFMRDPMTVMLLKGTSVRELKRFYQGLGAFTRAFLDTPETMRRRLIEDEVKNFYEPETKIACLTNLPGSETVPYLITRATAELNH
jgi:hypothetical protein